MYIFIRDLVEYEVFGNPIPSNMDTFKTFNIDKKLFIENDKPNIREITRVRIKVIVKEGNIVKTVKGISFEGKKFTGYKYASNCEIKVRIEYIPDEKKGSLIAINDEIAATTYIMLWDDFNANNKLINNIFIEDCYIVPLNKRCLLLNLSCVSTLEK